MRESRLPPGGVNKFQEIKKVMADARVRGMRLVDISIGEPDGPALLSARKVAAEAVMSESKDIHGYQDNGCLAVPDFAQRFVAGHVHIPPSQQVDCLPIPGIKPVLEMIPLACGPSLEAVATTTNPGYPVPKTCCQYFKLRVVEPVTNTGNNFLFDPDDLDVAMGGGKIGLLMTNYPHNPSGAIATLDWWRRVLPFCVKRNIRVANDAAYMALNYGPDSCPLAVAARDFPELSWVELLSASKLIGNGTGWRVGALVGSPDFVNDIRTIKGNIDSGFFAPAAIGALHALEYDKDSIDKVANTYRARVGALCPLLGGAGMRLATTPRAGFFTLWQSPKRAFGEAIINAKVFNLMMIDRTGIVGVPFEQYIRYAVAATDVLAASDELKTAFDKAEVSYD